MKYKIRYEDIYTAREELRKECKKVNTEFSEFCDSREACVGCPYESDNIVCLTEYVKNNYGEQLFEFEVVDSE